jgi:hypothetical protein
MLRRVAIALVVLAAGTAHADPPPCAPEPVDATLLHLAVQVDAGQGGVLLPTPGSSFPAISDDGTTIVDLFQDETDFVGEPVSTLATFTRRGPGAAVQLMGPMPGQPAGPEDVQEQARAMQGANALLAKHRWRALPLAATCSMPAGGTIDQALVVGFGDGLEIAFDPSTRVLSRDGHALAQRFPTPGGGEFGDCGAAIAIARAYGSRTIGFVVLEPAVNLGGDSCMGKLGVDDTIFVPIH